MSEGGSKGSSESDGPQEKGMEEGCRAKAAAKWQKPNDDPRTTLDDL